MMEKQSGKTTPSGIEPVDRLMGGLDSEQLYIVHGEAPARSLFGISFLIEGLKRGEQVALVSGCSPADAARQFARLGYDCLEDIYDGRLVILEASNEPGDRGDRFLQLAPSLRELEWLLGETHPNRLVFDGIPGFVVNDQTKLEARIAEFALWTRSLGAAVLVIGSEDNSELTHLFKPYVAESFRFEGREAVDNATQFIVFEKSLALEDRAIEVDPKRGIFLTDRRPASKFAGASSAAPRSEFRRRESEAPAPTKPFAVTPNDEQAATRHHVARRRDNEQRLLHLDLASIEDAVERLEEHKDCRVTPGPRTATSGASAESPCTSNEVGAEERGVPEFDLVSELFGELATVFFPGDLGQPQPTPPSIKEPSPRTGALGESTPAGSQPPKPVEPQPSRAQPTGGEPGSLRPSKHNRASDMRIDATIAARAVETLLRQPKTRSSRPAPTATAEPASAAQKGQSVEAGNFKVLVIDDDTDSCALIAESLRDFTVEQVHDGVSALGKLISYKPDLVVLDVDLPVVDGFKVLAHIRASLNVPVIIVSGTLLRASDRVLSAELGADYLLTRPFSAKELRHKARQLIARYRGIDSWIIGPQSRAAGYSVRSSDRADEVAGSDEQLFTPYRDFVEELENRVKGVLNQGSALSVVGCRVPQMATAQGCVAQARLRELVRRVVRETDLTSTNPPGDVVVLLADAGTSGARAFASRLRETVAQKMNQEPSLWMRSFPELEEIGEPASSPAKATNGSSIGRRATDSYSRG
ncbi:MAG TPA: response regulator [Blastocatellia bacterium]|nr:response regulator [Blastocatellia bacterium]